MRPFGRRTFGIQARLIMFATVTALPLVLLASLAILQTVEDQRTHKAAVDKPGKRPPEWNRTGQRSTTLLAIASL